MLHVRAERAPRVACGAVCLIRFNFFAHKPKRRRINTHTHTHTLQTHHTYMYTRTHTCTNTGTRMKATSACQRHVQCSINNFVHTLTHTHTDSFTHTHTYSYSHVLYVWIVDAGLTGGISFCAHTHFFTQ